MTTLRLFENLGEEAPIEIVKIEIPLGHSSSHTSWAQEIIRFIDQFLGRSDATIGTAVFDVFQCKKYHIDCDKVENVMKQYGRFAATAKSRYDAGTMEEAPCGAFLSMGLETTNEDMEEVFLHDAYVLTIDDGVGEDD